MAEAESVYANPLPPDARKFKHASCVDDNLASKQENRYCDFVGQGWSQNHTDDQSSSASAKYFAAHTCGTSMVIMQLHKPGRKTTAPAAKYHSGLGKVTVSRWSPHNHSLLASGDESGSVKIHYFEEDLFDDKTGLLKADVEEAMTTLDTGLSKKVTSIAWHPVIKNLIALSGGEGDSDFVVKFFDVDTGREVCPPVVTQKQVCSLTWSWDSKHIAWTDKTNKGHTCVIYNLKALGGPQKTGEIKTDLIRSSCTFMNDAVDADDHHKRCNKYICVIGSSGARSKTSMDIYDYSGNVVGKFNFPGTGKVYAMWDSGRNFMWIFVKGSGQLRGLAWQPKKKTFKVSCHHVEGNRRLKGGAFVPQAGCQVMEYVVAMLMGLEGESNTGEIWPFRFVIPRKQKNSFEAVLYPDIVSVNQEMSAAEWEGADADSLPAGPKMASCDPQQAEGDVEFVKKATYGELSALVEEYEAFIMSKLNAGAYDKDALPASLKAKLEEAEA